MVETLTRLKVDNLLSCTKVVSKPSASRVRRLPQQAWKMLLTINLVDVVRIVTRLFD